MGIMRQRTVVLVNASYFLNIVLLSMCVSLQVQDPFLDEREESVVNQHN